MSMLFLFGVLFGIVVLLTIINAVGRAEHPFRKACAGVLSGFLALAVVNLISPITGVAIPVSALSVITAAAGGIPGVTLILALSAFF